MEEESHMVNGLVSHVTEFQIFSWYVTCHLMDDQNMNFLLFFLHLQKIGMSSTPALPLTLGKLQYPYLKNENNDSISFLRLYGGREGLVKCLGLCLTQNTRY